MKKLMLIAVATLSLCACAEIELASHVVKKLPSPVSSGGNTGSSTDNGYFKVGNPYRIKGTYYRPKETYQLVETGTASWYGPNFHGKKTANGETFDMYAMTAAHRTLQMPSIIKVTNLANGRNVILRVNDRGPFSKNRVLDVSKKAAERLGFKNQGTARVKIEVLPGESRHVASLAKQRKSTRNIELAMAKNPAAYKVPTPYSKPKPMNLTLNTAVPAVETAPLKPAALGGGTYVQAGAFRDAENAQKLADALRSFGHAHVKPQSAGQHELYRVRFGPMKVAEANTLIDRLEEYRRIDAIAVNE